MSEKTLADSVQLRTVLQRCKQAEVVIDEKSLGRLASGLMLFVGFALECEPRIDDFAVQLTALDSKKRQVELQPLFQKWWDKVSQLRIFSDDQGRMNVSLLQQPENSGVYLVSQFTLFADVRKGNRPGFSAALSAAAARLCFEDLVDFVKLRCGSREFYSGVFAADMNVSLTNDGPVTLLFDCSMARGVEGL